MKWESLSAFVAMGGYAGFVWGSYAAAVACIAAEVIVLIARHRRARSLVKLSAEGK